MSDMTDERLAEIEREIDEWLDHPDLFKIVKTLIAAVRRLQRELDEAMDAYSNALAVVLQHFKVKPIPKDEGGGFHAWMHELGGEGCVYGYGNTEYGAMLDCLPRLTVRWKDIRRELAESREREKQYNGMLDHIAECCIGTWNDNFIEWRGISDIWSYIDEERLAVRKAAEGDGGPK